MFYRKESDHLESDEVVTSRERQLRLQQLGLLLVFIAAFYHMAKGHAPWSAAVINHIKEVAPQIEHPKDLVMIPAWFQSDTLYPGVLRPKEHAIIGLWWGAAFAAAVSFLLLATSPFWMPRHEKEGRESLEVEESDDENAGDTGLAKLVSSGPIFYVLVALAMAIGGWLRAPLLDHSLWNDEEYAMRRFAHGSWETSADAPPKFVPVSWQDTLFENSNGNNHLLNSLLTRVSLTMSGASSKTGSFTESGLRMPAIIAGILTIGVIAFLGWEIGMPWVGIGAAWLLALHPWHLRYSAEAKGYALMMFFTSLALLGLVRAMKHHRNRDWQMFAIGEAGFLLSFAGAIYVALAVNIVAVIELIFRRQPRRLAALVVFNLLASIPVVVWTLPSIPQVLAFTHRTDAATQTVTPVADRLHDLGSHIAAGVMYNNPETSEHLGTSWTQMTAANHTEPMVLAYGVGLFLVLGLVAALFENSAARIIILGVGLGGALAFWQAGVQHQPNFAWYYIYLVIPAVLAVTLACVRLQLLPAFIVILVVGFVGKATELPRSIFSKNDRQPMRETVAALREKHPESLTGTFGVSDRQIQSYDPKVHLLNTPEDVDKLLAEGKEMNVPVFVYFCGVTETTKRKPEMVKRVATSEDFIPYKQFKGLEAMFTYHTFVWRGSPP